VPLVVASPWSRGGWVCSEVFDHTSTLQLLETLLTKRTGKQVEETNISRWRRTVCGDLASVFRAARGEAVKAPAFPPRDAFIQEIHQARFTKLPSGYRSLIATEVEQARASTAISPLVPPQEEGIRPSCALPYQLYADGSFDAGKRRFTLRLEARDEVFGSRAAGAPFTAYAFGGSQQVKVRAYAAAAGTGVVDDWELEGPGYHLQVHGPNGWMRELRGSATDPPLEVQVDYARTRRSRSALTGEVEIRLVNRDRRNHQVVLTDHAYGSRTVQRVLRPGDRATLRVPTRRSHGWYDFSLTLAGVQPFAKRCAGRVETGKASYSDPAMGKRAER
jgi:phospholipase C